MTCCGKIKQIAEGYSNLVMGVKYQFTDERVRICQGCEVNYWIGQSLWCSECKCFIPAKARVKENTCPKGKWER
jgi:hypothetical protein